MERPSGNHLSRVLALLSAGLVVISLLSGAACRRQSAAGDPRAELVIFHAGSLAVPFREVSRRFNELYPHVVVRAEAAGSVDSARKVSDLGRRCDVLGSADYQVIDRLLIPQHADYSIRFAGNEMVIAYTDRSAYADVVNAQSWPEILLADDVAFGRADPSRDPCGYRTVMVFHLAEKHYQIPGLARRLEEKHRQKYIRPKETDLLALLESGEIDYLFIYRSVASQHQLRFVLLPDEVNLKSAALSGLYATAKVSVAGAQPGECVEHKGTPMAYGVTIPSGCENRAMAEAWVQLLLSPEGQAIMEHSGQPPIAPAWTDQFDRLPDTLKPLCRRMSGTAVRDGFAGPVASPFCGRRRRPAALCIPRRPLRADATAAPGVRRHAPAEAVAHPPRRVSSA